MCCCARRKVTVPAVALDAEVCKFNTESAWFKSNIFEFNRKGVIAARRRREPMGQPTLKHHLSRERNDGQYESNDVEDYSFHIL